LLQVIRALKIEEHYGHVTFNVQKTFVPDFGSRIPPLKQYYQAERLHAQPLLKFCNKWGLFGKAWDKGPLIGNLDEALQIKTLSTMFHTERADITKWDHWLAIKQGAEKQLRDAGEDVYDICSDLELFSMDWNDWERFRAGGIDPESDYGSGLTWKERFNNIQADSNLRIRFDGKCQIDYEFESLLQALRLMLMLNMVSDIQQIKRCALPSCRNNFLVQSANATNVIRNAKNDDIRSGKALYCSDPCASKARVKKFRAKAKKEREAAREKAKARIKATKRAFSNNRQLRHR
jgi:hypothetical protein